MSCIKERAKDQIRKLDDQEKREQILLEKRQRKKKNEEVYSPTDNFTRAQIATFPWNWSNTYWGNAETEEDFTFNQFFSSKDLRD